MVMTALLTRMSSLPCWSSTSWTTLRQSSGVETLPWWIVARTCSPKRSSNSATNCSARAVFALYPAATEAPWAAKLRQIPAPMPRVPPVTSATRPASLSPTKADCSTDVVGLSMVTELMAFMVPLPECRRTRAGRRQPPGQKDHRRSRHIHDKYMTNAHVRTAPPRGPPATSQRRRHRTTMRWHPGAKYPWVPPLRRPS